MNELRYKNASIENRIKAYFEIARDSTTFSTEAGMLTAAMALMYLLQDAEGIDKKAIADRIRDHAKKCGINHTAVMTAIDDLEKGGEKI